jgi:hypothetical protein
MLFRTESENLKFFYGVDFMPRDNPSPVNQSVPRTISLSHSSAEATLFGSYSVVGIYSDGPGTFVRHVALLAVDTKLPAEKTPIWHMGPPINHGEGTSQPFMASRIDVAADVVLSARERKSMAHWKAKVAAEQRPIQRLRQYTVAPPVRWIRGENGRRLYRRFSCVGFVISCYEAAGITLIDINQRMPDANNDLVSRMYPEIDELAQRSPEVQCRIGYDGKDELGLQGDGPWSLILPGYLFHSLTRFTIASPRPSAFLPSSTAMACFPLANDGI